MSSIACASYLAKHLAIDPAQTNKLIWLERGEALFDSRYPGERAGYEREGTRYVKLKGDEYLQQYIIDKLRKHNAEKQAR